MASSKQRLTLLLTIPRTKLSYHTWDEAFFLSYLQRVSVFQHIDWKITRGQDGVLLSSLVLNMHSGTTRGDRLQNYWQGVKKDFSTDKTPCCIHTFVNCFREAGGQHPAQNIIALGWVHSNK